jgi:hypothetical protein
MRTRTYDVTIAFRSGGSEYGREKHVVEAVDRTTAGRAALVKAEDSRFDDPRIPDLSRRIVSCRLAA